MKVRGNWPIGSALVCGHPRSSKNKKHVPLLLQKSLGQLRTLHGGAKPLMKERFCSVVLLVPVLLCSKIKVSVQSDLEDHCTRNLLLRREAYTTLSDTLVSLSSSRKNTHRTPLNIICNSGGGMIMSSGVFVRRCE